MEEKMTEEFIQEVKTVLNGLIGEGLPAEHHRILRKGDHDPEYKSHIRSINEQYYHLDSDVMSGNWLLVFVVSDQIVARINLDDLKSVCDTSGTHLIRETLKKAVESAQRSSVTIGNLEIGEFASVRDSLIVRLIRNSEINSFGDMPVLKKYRDFSVVVYLELGHFGDEYYTAKVHQSYGRIWNMSDEQIYEAALANMAEKYPPRIAGISLKSHGEIAVPKKPFMHENDEENFIHVCLMNTKEINGASALFYPGVMKRLYTLAKEPFYAVFTSNHEVHIHAVSEFTPSFLRKSLAKTNKMFSDEKVTDTIFRYDPKSDDIFPVEN